MNRKSKLVMALMVVMSCAIMQAGYLYLDGNNKTTQVANFMAKVYISLAEYGCLYYGNPIGTPIVVGDDINMSPGKKIVGNVTGTLTGNADTVTKGVYTDSENVIGAGHMKGASSTKLANGSSGNLLKSLGDGTFGWDATAYLSSVTAHNLLSATHGDSVIKVATRGMVMYADEAGKWNGLAFPASPTGKVLQATATDLSWSASALGTMAWSASADYLPLAGGTMRGELIGTNFDTTSASGAYQLNNTNILWLGAGSYSSNMFVGNGGSAIKDSAGGGSDGHNNTFLGNNAGLSATTTLFSTGVGTDALKSLATGLGNTGCGYESLNYVTAQQSNSALGYYAGSAYSGGNATPHQGTYIGSSTQSGVASATNETVIGYNAVGNGSNTVTLGNSSVIGNYTYGSLTFMAKACIKPSVDANFFYFADQDGNAIMTVDSTNNRVAVGTSTPTPTGTLDVCTSNTATPYAGQLLGLQLTNPDISANTLTGIMFKAKDSGGTYRHGGAIVAGKESDWSSTVYSYLSFWTRGASDEVEAMRINSSGNVGIGLTAPLSRLSVGNNQNAGTIISVHNTTAGASSAASFRAFTDTGKHAALGMYSSGTTAYGCVAAGDGFVYSSSAGGLVVMAEAGYIKFAAGSTAEIARINSSGLGVGCTPSSYGFEVGSAKTAYWKNNAHWYTTSDESLKENIATIPDALTKIKGLRGVTYKWRDKVKRDDRTHWGMIAQEVQTVMPEWVRTEKDGTLGLQIEDTALFIQAFKEQDAKITTLETTVISQQKLIDDLTTRIEKLEKQFTPGVKINPVGE